MKAVACRVASHLCVGWKRDRTKNISHDIRRIHNKAAKRWENCYRRRATTTTFITIATKEGREREREEIQKNKCQRAAFTQNNAQQTNNNTHTRAPMVRQNGGDGVVGTAMAQQTHKGIRLKKTMYGNFVLEPGRLAVREKKPFLKYSQSYRVQRTPARSHPHPTKKNKLY